MVIYVLQRFTDKKLYINAILMVADQNLEFCKIIVIC